MFLTSRGIRMGMRESAVIRQSLVALTWAVSVLWRQQKPNWIDITAADLRGDESEPEVREGWMMAVMRDDREGRQPAMRGVGRGSSWQVDDLDFLMSSVMAAAEGRWKLECGWEKGIWGTGENELSEIWEASWQWILSVFASKMNYR